MACGASTPPTPLIISAPGKKAGQRTPALAEFVDVYPTLCDLAGIPKPAHLQGESLVPLLDSPAGPSKTAAFQVYPRSSKETGALLGHAVRTNRWRYVEWQKSDGSAAARELYDMQGDPGEATNLAAKPEHSAIVAEHSEILRKRLATLPPAGLKLIDLAKPAAAPKVDRAALFTTKDTDQNGKLTREEFMRGQPDPDQAPQRFTRFDADKNGELSREEFISQGR